MSTEHKHPYESRFNLPTRVIEVTTGTTLTNPILSRQSFDMNDVAIVAQQGNFHMMSPPNVLSPCLNKLDMMDNPIFYLDLVVSTEEAYREDEPILYVATPEGGTYLQDFLHQNGVRRKKPETSYDNISLDDPEEILVVGNMYEPFDNIVTRVTLMRGGGLDTKEICTDTDSRVLKKPIGERK